jgi:radical SAM superfamily enzyme YgiQ (UPF0313 family)
VRTLLINTNRHDLYYGNLPIRPMPLGLAYILANIDEARHPVQVLDLMFAADPLAETARAVRAFRPEVIGLSIRNLDNQSYLRPVSFLPFAREVVGACRGAAAARIVVGGTAFSLLPREAFAYLEPNFGMTGNAERTFPRLLDLLEAGADPAELPGLVHRRGDAIQVNDLPEPAGFARLPRRTAFDLRRYAASGYGVGVVTKMGTFAYPSEAAPAATPGYLLTIRPIDDLLGELAHLAEGMDIGQVFFVDPAFNVPLEHAKALCRALLERRLRIRWATPIGLGPVDAELAGLMREAGCVMASLGGIGRIQDAISDHAAQALALRANCAALRGAGIPHAVSLIFGRPGETRATVEEALACLADARPDFVTLIPGVRILPHSPLARRAIAEGLIRDQADLLQPAFYLASQVKEWLIPRLREAAAQHPGWALG